MTTFLAFIIVLSFLVFVHELGHFTVAKLSGIGVERFSIGLPPRLFGVRIGETEYCISMIPFGGYVKMIGQDDFSYDEDEVGGETDPRDYRLKPTPVKIAVLAAGSIMNLLTAVLIFSFLFYTEGVPEQTTKIGYVRPGTPAAELGIVHGDVITAVDGESIESLDQVYLNLYSEEKTSLSIERDGMVRTVEVPRRLGEKEDFGITPYYLPQIDRALEGSPAERAGIRPGDIILAIDGVRLTGGWIHMTEIIEAHPEERMLFSVMRDGRTLEIPVTAGSETETDKEGGRKKVGKVGMAVRFSTKHVGGFGAVAMAFDRTSFIALKTLDFFGKLVTGRISPKLLGGPVLIAQVAGESAKSGLTTLLGFTAFISINLGVLNLLPFPVLDGGHIAILLFETGIRRKLSARIRMAIQQAGSIVLLLFMIYITFNDLLRLDRIARIFGG